MYPHFIEVTCELGDDEHRTIEKRLINVDSIVVVSDNVIDCGKDGTWYAEESYDELKELIRSAGCHIEKGDPRLDQTKPLTMNDLKDMVGQPVWDSNTDTWLLVYEGDWTYTPDPDRVCVRVVNRYGCNKIWLSEKDLIAKPLYRMKR